MTAGCGTCSPRFGNGMRMPTFLKLIYRIGFPGILLLTLACGEGKRSIAPELRPNMIWLVAEDQSPHFFPMYGNSTIALPHLESLTRDGVLFTNAYAPVPVCAPARSAIITGMYPTTLGTHNMRTYNAYTKENQPELGIPSYSPVVPEGTVMFTQLLRKNGYYCTNNAKEDYNFKGLESAWDQSGDTAHWRNRPANHPFFSVFNFGVCHESGIWRNGAKTLFVSKDSVPVPPYFPDDSIIRHDLAVNYSNLKRMDDQLGEILDQLKEDGLYENSIIFFYGDHGGPFPRHKRALYETGTKVPMIIKFPANHKKGSRDRRLFSFVDLAPTVLSLARIESPKAMQGSALFGRFKRKTEPKYLFFSSDRFDGQVDRVRAVRSKKYKYIKNFDVGKRNVLPIVYRNQMPMMQRLNQLHEADSLNPAQSLWYRLPKPEEELYDLENDPYELVNLTERKALQDTLLHLRAVLSEWIRTSNDLGRIPEKELIDHWLVDGQQPQLQPLEFYEEANKVHLVCKESDATIIWKGPDESAWNIYGEPLSIRKTFRAKAVRIGFRDSEILQYGPH